MFEADVFAQAEELLIMWTQGLSSLSAEINCWGEKTLKMYRMYHFREPCLIILTL